MARDAATGDRVVSVTPATGSAVWQWVVREFDGERWATSILPGSERRHRLLASGPIRVSAVSRTGMESPVVTLGCGASP
jgi:hypothetical protein